MINGAGILDLRLARNEEKDAETEVCVNRFDPYSILCNVLRVARDSKVPLLGAHIVEVY